MLRIVRHIVLRRQQQRLCHQRSRHLRHKETVHAIERGEAYLGRGQYEWDYWYASLQLVKNP